ncbi:unnamed protein product [Acidocella sp. C78]|nr:unnamed protein product [Acidocella sp. C78]
MRPVPVGMTVCGSRVFQAPQASHRPAHFGTTAPHSLHTKRVALFAIQSPVPDEISISSAASRTV